MLTRASWEKLQEMTREYDFVVIGGWAAFLWTGKHKSKDIDIVVDYEGLQKLKQDYDVRKNDRLRKYEIKLDKVDIDVYVPFYSRLAIPLEKLETVRIQGVKTVTAEELLVLKQGAEIARRGSVKGRKDAIDILTLLFYGDVDFGKYRRLLRKHGLDYENELRQVLREFDVKKDLKFLDDVDLKRFRDWQKKVLEELRKQ